MISSLGYIAMALWRAAAGSSQVRNSDFRCFQKGHGQIWNIQTRKTQQVCSDFLLTQVFNFTFINHCKNDIILQDWDVIIPASGFKEASVSVRCDDLRIS